MFLRLFLFNVRSRSLFICTICVSQQKDYYMILCVLNLSSYGYIAGRRNRQGCESPPGQEPVQRFHHSVHS